MAGAGMRRWFVLVPLTGAVLFSGALHAVGTQGDGPLIKRNAALRKQIIKERKQLHALQRIAAPILRPTPEGNKRLARAYFENQFPCAAKIIDGETAGTWDERIWNYEGSGAYGLGQARPRDKMLKYGADAYTNPLTQYVWMEAYADERFGGICNASAQWSVYRSW